MSEAKAKDQYKEGKPATLKVQMDARGRHLMIYNEDKSLYKQVDDPYVSGFLATLLELDGPLAKKYAKGRIGTDENGDVTFRIDAALDKEDWPTTW